MTDKGKEIEMLSLEFSTGANDINEFESYLNENLDYDVTVIRQTFPAYTTYSISYQVAVGDVRVSSITMMPKETVEK